MTGVKGAFLGGNDGRGLDGPDESMTSFGSVGLPTKTVKYAWAQGHEKVSGGVVGAGRHADLGGLAVPGMCICVLW